VPSVDRTDHLFHRGELIALPQHPEAQRVLHLLDQLEIRSDPRTSLETELDHVLIP